MSYTQTADEVLTQLRQRLYYRQGRPTPEQQLANRYIKRVCNKARARAKQDLQFAMAICAAAEVNILGAFLVAQFPEVEPPKWNPLTEPYPEFARRWSVAKRAMHFGDLLTDLAD